MKDLQKAISEIYLTLLQEERRDKAVPLCLRKLGTAAGLDRISVFETGETPGEGAVTFQWGLPCKNEPAPAQLDFFQQCVLQTFQPLRPEDLEGVAMPRNVAEKTFLAERGMNSALAFPVFQHERFWGMILMESSGDILEWDSHVHALLQAVSCALGISFHRWVSEEKLKTKNDELNSAVERARKSVIESERANAAKGEFLARMSHEIRTPMNGILGMARLLSYQEMPEEQKEQIGIILQSGEMLLHIINDILDFSKIEAGKLQVREEGFDLHAMLESVDALLRPKAEEKQLEYESVIAEDVPRLVMGDSVRIRQILMNLIGNALKFTSRGKVQIRTDCLGFSGKIAKIRFEISDTGSGISPEDLPRLFDEFSQVDGSSVREYEGAGLGLAIVSRLLNMMNGEVTVESEKGKGSLFRVTLDLMKTNALPEGDSEEFPEEILMGRKVLVVDDNRTNLDIVGGLLEKWKCQHTETQDPQEALNTLEEAYRAGNPYLCAIVDMMMPGLDGVQLAQRVRANPALSETLLMVMLSSGDIREIEPELKKAGFVGVMQKPVHAQQLHAVLTNALYQHDRTKASVLVVDDDEVTLQCMQRILQREYEVFTAASTAEADTLLQGNHGIDLLFCDQEMPGEKGLEFCKRLQEEGSPVVRVLITGYLDPDFLLDAINSQALFRYLVKPVRQEQLMQTASEALEERKRRNEDKLKISFSENLTRIQTAQEVPSEERNEGPIRILLAEDNPVNQKVAVSFLKRLDIESEVANNGREALDLLKRESFDAVLMDLHMPEMDGLEAVREIRKWEQESHRNPVPVIALTADAIKGDREKCLEAGMDDYITKPLKLQSLQEALSRTLRVAGS